AEQQSLETLRSIACDRDLFTIAAEQLCQACPDGFRLWLENLPHRLRGRVFLLPDVANQRLSDNARAWANTAVVQIDNAAGDAERILDSRPVIFIGGCLLRRE